MKVSRERYGIEVEKMFKAGKETYCSVSGQVSSVYLVWFSS